MEGKRSRGIIFEEELIEYKYLDFESLKKLLNSKEPFKRSIATRLLADNYLGKYEDELSTVFIEFLKNEKSLYTRIEVQNALQKGESITIQKLCEIINEIPNKQHVKLPDKITRKKTYPIARDLPTRILAKMGIKALSKIKATIDLGQEEVITQILDAYGYILYHSSTNLDEDQYIINLFERYGHNEVLIWKLIRVVSGTKSNHLKNYLLGYNKNNKILQEEIKRTITFIDK